jgi:S-(hydroxymethyl)glutathione dehydrogenase/alcohol dehydrogenase
MYLTEGRQLSDGTARHHAGDEDLALMCLLGTFAERTVVHEDSCIKVDPDVPLDKACLLACGVLTGWGSAVYGAKVRPGEDVAVIGVGGVGINAVQGAKHAGAHRIFAIDPVPFKRDKAMEFGATHTAASLEEAQALVADETRGRLCHKVIMTMGVGRGDLIASALAITAKRGRVVVTNVHPAAEIDVKMSMLDLTMLEKRVVGCLLGSARARADVPQLIGLYRDGQLKLDELITRTYELDDINVGYDDMREGRNIRGVLNF